MDKLTQQLVEGLGETPVIDVHTHLVGGSLGARGLHDILLYHMAISDLYAAGCPTVTRLTEYPAWPDREEARRRIEEALPHLPDVRNTSTSWGIRTILSDLYDWDGPVTERDWRTLDGRVRERAGDREWERSVLRRVNIKRVGTEIIRRQGGIDDDIMQYALEWAFFTRCQWGEYDTALYELERCWGKAPSAPTPIGTRRRPPTDRVVRTLDDVRAAVTHYVEAMPVDEILSTASHISTDLDLSAVTDDEMDAALEARATAGPRERDIYASYVNEAFLSELEAKAPEVVFQFSYGAEPLPHETASRLSQRSIAQVAEMISRHPGLRFQCTLASRHANQSMCTLCRELPNLSLSGYWWHNFFPGAIRQVMEERLDMLPVNKQIGFFSDAYCLEWTYGKVVMVRRLLAEVLASKVRLGQYSVEESLGIARETLYESPRRLLRFEPTAA